MKRQRGEPIFGKKSDREAKARSKHGIPEDTRIWTSENGWVTYRDGLITLKMSLTPAQLIPLQDITVLDFKAPTKLLRGTLRFNRAGDTAVTRQEMIFTKDDEAAFADLRNELERDRKLGVTAPRPEVAATDASGNAAPGQTPGNAWTSDQEFRAKYNIPSDAVLAVSPGEGYVSFDGHVVSLQRYRWGLLSVGKGVKRMPVTAITSIQMKPVGPMGRGFIQFSHAGGNEVRSESLRQSYDASHDEDSMVFYKNEPDFLALRDAIEKAQLELHQPRMVQAAPATQPDDLYAQLEKLGKLRDAGILTDSEFEAKKAELLARI